MKDFNYIIIGGGCAGLSLAYELEINNKLENKTLAIIEPRTNYIRDKTWSFWRIDLIILRIASLKVGIIFLFILQIKLIISIVSKLHINQLIVAFLQ